MYQNMNHHKQSQNWCESIWGLILISIFLNVISNSIYDKGKNHLRKLDRLRERRRRLNHSINYHNKTEKQAKEIDDETK